MVPTYSEHSTANRTTELELISSIGLVNEGPRGLPVTNFSTEREAFHRHPKLN